MTNTAIKILRLGTGWFKMRIAPCNADLEMTSFGDFTFKVESLTSFNDILRVISITT